MLRRGLELAGDEKSGKVRKNGPERGRGGGGREGEKQVGYLRKELNLLSIVATCSLFRGCKCQINTFSC